VRADLGTLVVRRLAPAALALSLGACDWFTDFKDQPRIEPWESYALADSAGRIDTALARRLPFRGQPQYSVPITGSVMPAMAVSYTPGIAQLDSMRGLANPVAADERSLQNGRRYYQINCAVCHGASGQGNGPATYYGLPVPGLTTPQAQAYPDGYLFGIIRNGRGLMPTYNRIEEMDRWDVVNYLRGLQGRFAVDTTAAGQPGETGRTVPGYTLTAPTRPAPYTTLRREPADTAAPRGAPTVPPGTGADSVRADSARAAGAAAGTTPPAGDSAARPTTPPPPPGARN
jgi:mono/diheme cytochrome c family protein